MNYEFKEDQVGKVKEEDHYKNAVERKVFGTVMYHQQNFKSMVKIIKRLYRSKETQKFFYPLKIAEAKINSSTIDELSINSPFTLNREFAQ